MAQHRIVEHPSDLGIEAWGENTAKAFEQSVQGLISAVIDVHRVILRESRPFTLTAADRESLLVKLLSEVLYQLDGERFITGSVTFSEISDTRAAGFFHGEAIDEKRHDFKLDVKAVTYHQILVKETAAGVFVRVFVDI